jgi:cell division protease FtsH
VTRAAPHLGSLLGKASRPLRSVLLLWSFLAATTYWGTPRISVRDAFATAYNDNGFLQALIAAAIGFGALQVLMRLLPSLREAVLTLVSSLLPRRLRALPLYTRRQLKGVLRLVVFLSVFFWVLSKVRGGRTGQLISAGLSQLPLQLPAWLFQGALTLGIVAGQFLLLFFVLSRGGISVYLPEEIKTNFSMVWGQDAVLEKVKEVVTYLKTPEIIESRGGHVPGGVLLWGPPGTGKTLIAEAVAGETATPFVLVEPAAFQNMFVGIGPLKVRNLYKKLRKLSEVYGGVVVFFDEADVLGSRSRGQGDNGLRSSPEEVGSERLKVMAMGGDLGILNAILANMQGVRTPKGLANRIRRSLGIPVSPPPKYRILHMMATNMPNSLDPAMLRPGRIDRIFRVGYPSREGRIRTFQGYLTKVRHNLSEEQVAELAVITTNATGAVIKDIVNEALIASLREGREEITWADFLNAKRFKEFGPPEGVEYVPFERHAVAVHEACHAFAAWKLRNHLTIDTVTIEKGQDYLGMVSSRPTEDLFTRWRSEYRIDIAVALSSLAGERLFFDGDSTSGVAGDLDQATRLAALMTGRWGMGESIASRNALIDSGMSDDVLDSPRRVEDLLREVFAEIAQMIADDRQIVLALAHALEHLKTLAGPDVVALFERRPGLFLDGRVYTGETAGRILEEYHEELKASRHAGSLTRTPSEVAALLHSRFIPGEWPTPVTLAGPTSVETSAPLVSDSPDEPINDESDGTPWDQWPSPDGGSGQLDNPDKE